MKKKITRRKYRVPIIPDYCLNREKLNRGITPKLRQYDVQKVLGMCQSSISKRFINNSFRGEEILKVKKELKIPAEALFDKEVQKKYFGVSFIK